MPWSRSDRAHANRGWICWSAIAAFTAALLPLTATAPASAATLDRVREAGKIVLGYRADARPFAFRDEAGKASGYAIALCQKIADQVKVELKLSTLAVEWTPVTVSDQFRAVQENPRARTTTATTATLFLDETGERWVSKYAPGKLRAKRIAIYSAMRGFTRP